jgi:hypothetical protein
MHSKPRWIVSARFWRCDELLGYRAKKNYHGGTEARRSKTERKLGAMSAKQPPAEFETNS